MAYALDYCGPGLPLKPFSPSFFQTNHPGFLLVLPIPEALPTLESLFPYPRNLIESSTPNMAVSSYFIYQLKNYLLRGNFSDHLG